MKRIVIGLTLTAITGAANAADLLQCDYAKGALTTGTTINLTPMGKGNVEFDGKAFKAYRPDGTFIVTATLTGNKSGLIFLDDKTKVFAASMDKSNFAVSDRIAKINEQWSNCSEDKASSQQRKNNDEMKLVESMTSSQAKKYFLNERHSFTTNCLVWDDVTMITGKNPAIIMAGSVNMGKSPRWDGREYSFTFNGGSMMARFVPSEPRHKFVIQGGDKFYGCGPSEIDHNYD